MSAQMAVPFMRLNDWLQWAKEEHGCVIRTGYLATPDLWVYTFVQAPSGKWVVIPDLKPDEAQPVHAYEYYNRRLGLDPPALM